MNQHGTDGSFAPLGAPPAQALRRRKGVVSERGRSPTRTPASATRRGTPSSRRLREQHPDTGEPTPRYPSLKAQPWTFVEERDGTPLGMAHPAVGRKWVKKGKARMHRFGPAVVRLACPHAQACFARHWGRSIVKVGVDPGSKTGGLAIIRDNIVIWSAQVWYRSKRITKSLTTRANVRSGRRCRNRHNTRRPRKEARFKHRKRPAGWLAPGVWHRVQSTLRWLRYALRYASVAADGVEIHVEVCAFDAHAVMNPEVHGTGYQQGPLFRANLRSYVLARDGAWCRYCGTEKGPFEMEHAISKAHGGADAPWNRVPACRECNQDKGNLPVEQWVAGSSRVPEARRHDALRHVRRVAQGKVKLNHLAAANVVAPAIARECRALGDDLDWTHGWTVVETSGADTAWWRRCQGVEKTHAIDAMCTAAKDTPVSHRNARALRMDMTGRGRRLVIKVNKSGFPRLKNKKTTCQGRKAWEKVLVTGHRETPPCGLRAGDTVYVNKPDFGRRRRICVATTVRQDGRCVIRSQDGKSFNVNASSLTLAHRGLGARIT